MRKLLEKIEITKDFFKIGLGVVLVDEFID